MESRAVLLFGIAVGVALAVLICDGRPQTRQRLPWANRRFLRRKRPTNLPPVKQKQNHELDQRFEQEPEVSLISPLGRKHKPIQIANYYDFNVKHGEPFLNCCYHSVCYSLSVSNNNSSNNNNNNNNNLFI